MLQLKNMSVPSDIVGSIAQLWKDELFQDVRLVCMDGVVLASRLVLVAQSKLMEELMDSDTDTVLLQEFSYNSVQAVVSVLHGFEMSECTDEEHEEMMDSVAALGLRCFVATCGQGETEIIRSVDEDLEYIFGVSPDTPGVSPPDTPGVSLSRGPQSSDNLGSELSEDSQVRRSKRRNIGKHWKYTTGKKKSKSIVENIVEDTAKDVKDEAEEEFIYKSEPGLVDSIDDTLEASVDEINGNSAPCPIENHMKDPLHLNIKRRKRHGSRRKTPENKFSFEEDSEGVSEEKSVPTFPTQCQFCGLKLTRDSERVRHEENCGRGQVNTWYSITAEKGFQCSSCDQRFRRMTGMKAHLAYSHDQTLPFVCDQCGDSFITAARLKFHFNRVHSTKETRRGRRRDLNKGDMVGMYHLKKYPTYLAKEEAIKVLPTYYTSKENSHRCKVCEEDFSCEAQVQSHLLDSHLKLMLYKCPHCSQKLRDEKDYHAHIESEHQASNQTRSNLGSLETEIGQDGTTFNGEMETVEALEFEQSVTTIIIEKEESEEASSVGVDFSEVVEADLKKRKSGAKCEEIYVEGAEKPILGKTRTKLDKLTSGRLFSQKEAAALVQQNINRTILDRMYHCLVCQDDWQTNKMDVAKEHIYDHFGVYLYQCEKCLDLFRKQAHYLRHVEIHNRREEKSTIMEGDKVGDYHLLTDREFLPWKTAKPVIDTYHLKDVEGGKFSCKLCQYTCHNGPQIRNHLLQFHLKLNVFKCPECLTEFSLESEIKKHMLREHEVEFEGLEKVDDPEYESTETDFPGDSELILSLPMEELSGKKVSSAQGRLLRKTKITRNEADGDYECEMCDYKKEYQAQLSDHVMTAHFNVFMYKCGKCNKLLRNWSRYTTHRSTHTRAAENTGATRPKRQPFRVGSEGIKENFHLLEQDLYVGKEEGLKIAREYFLFDETSEKYQCKMCSYTGRHQTVEQHVLAIHLKKINLFKCPDCGKLVRYSENAYKNHLLLHSVGKLPCALCQKLDQGGEKRFTKASLAAHMRRIHRVGDFPCKTADCTAVFSTLAELRQHGRQEHFVGLPASRLQYMCEICNHTFPRKQQLEWHLESCQAGRSRSRFRKMIADCLTWLGQGAYSCNFCRETFHPPRPTASSLPLARKHVVTVHKMNHLRKAKMSWTQGVEGLNTKRKAQRKQSVHSEAVAEKVVCEETKEEVIFQYFVAEEIASTEEVEVNTAEEHIEEPASKIRVINTYFET